jgi:hypothetical protein
MTFFSSTGRSPPPLHLHHLPQTVLSQLFTFIPYLKIYITFVSHHEVLHHPCYIHGWFLLILLSPLCAVADSPPCSRRQHAGPPPAAVSLCWRTPRQPVHRRPLRQGRRLPARLLRLHQQQVHWPTIAQTHVGGCGHGNAKPNCNVIKVLHLSKCVAGAMTSNLSDVAIQKAAKAAVRINHLAARINHLPPPKPTKKPKRELAAAAAAATANDNKPKKKTVAELAASQQHKKVVGEVCADNSECRQGCCGFATGKCAGPDVAQTNESGWGTRRRTATSCRRWVSRTASRARRLPRRTTTRWCTRRQRLRRSWTGSHSRPEQTDKYRDCIMVASSDESRINMLSFGLSIHKLIGW